MVGNCRVLTTGAVEQGPPSIRGCALWCLALLVHANVSLGKKLNPWIDPRAVPAGYECCVIVSSGVGRWPLRISVWMAEWWRVDLKHFEWSEDRYSPRCVCYRMIRRWVQRCLLAWILKPVSFFYRLSLSWQKRKRKFKKGTYRYTIGREELNTWMFSRLIL